MREVRWCGAASRSSGAVPASGPVRRPVRRSCRRRPGGAGPRACRGHRLRLPCPGRPGSSGGRRDGSRIRGPDRGSGGYRSVRKAHPGGAQRSGAVAGQDGHAAQGSRHALRLGVRRSTLRRLAGHDRTRREAGMSGVKPAVWFPAVRAGTGSDKFTLQLCEALNARGIRAGITWLPHRAEYLPWTVRVPPVPGWANIVHVNTWLHPRFLPRGIPVVATLHHSLHHPALRPYKGALRAAYHRFWIAPIERRVMARAAKVVAVSRFAAEIGRATLFETPIKVIHNGIDVDRFRPIGERESPHRPFRLLYVGSWIARKGVDLLAPIMRELGPESVLHYKIGR